MSEINSLYKFYQQRFTVNSQYHAGLEKFQRQKICLVIPAYDEELDACLASLGRCKVDAPLISVLLVFNNEAGSAVTDKHIEQYRQWHKAVLPNQVPVQAISATDLPDKQAGVGMARKIGMDAALALFAESDYDGLILCLDADCRVAENYLEELLRAEAAGVKGLSIYFEHTLQDLAPEEQERIVLYEIWLRYYVQALRFIAYPFAFHTVGSSMAVRASVYARVGGMNRRKAGEDFYFLHKVIPQGQFYDLTSTAVYPSARISKRVPFGTGRAMLEMKEGRKDFESVYAPAVFADIRQLLSADLKGIIGPSDEFGEPITRALDALGWRVQLVELAARSPTKSAGANNFRHWLDGFRMLKLVHWLRDYYYPDVDCKAAYNNMLNDNIQDTLTLLNTLRKMDRNSSYSI